ncbi:MAG: hypothetical protein K0R09_1773, partial [Clostridiales bacterium]|nr:hypothetical protein [Clostridiales bacterium]
EDLFVEVSHGPYVVDNNIMLSMKSVRDMSQGGAYVNNLFGGFITLARVTNRFTPYHYAHETDVHGLMIILGGDDRYYNNIFIGTQPDNEKKEKTIDPAFWTFNGVKFEEDGSIIKGLALYNECPSYDENWYKDLHSVDEFAAARLPMYCGSNLYFNDAKPYRKEINSVVCSDMKPEVKVVTEGGGVYITFDFGDVVEKIETVTVTTDFLGIAFEPELPFERPDGTTLCIENDFFGNLRSAGKMIVGPFEGIGRGPQKIKVAEI